MRASPKEMADTCNQVHERPFATNKEGVATFTRSLRCIAPVTWQQRAVHYDVEEGSVNFQNIGSDSGIMGGRYALFLYGHKNRGSR